MASNWLRLQTRLRVGLVDLAMRLLKLISSWKAGVLAKLRLF
jgi:hypothetical protein